MMTDDHQGQAFTGEGPTPSTEGGFRIDPKVRLWNQRSIHLGLLILILFTASMTTFAGMDLLARNVLLRFDAVSAGVSETPAETPRAPVSRPAAFTMRSLDLHPDRLYRPYLTVFGAGENFNPATLRRIRDFRALLALYQTRQGIDDNFTIRVLDNRTFETLEVFTLTEDREAYRRGARIDWREIDRKRAKETRRLSKKYQALGFPRGAIMVKWGRADQVREARERETAFIEYEIRLARMLGLSLLATEVGTVETFNDDALVSRVGARSRYQIMPYLLRQNGIRHFKLRTAGGGRVQVLEERHPLLTMEPAFTLMRAYANAVGHELPGLSAYHSGPYNLFKIYRAYLTSAATPNTSKPNVLDAFLWGMTDGYATVSRSSSFRSASRAYVPSAYGSLRATETLPIDTTRTMRAERVQLKPGHALFLSELLGALEATGRRFDWGEAAFTPRPYDRFRAMNPHFLLPDAPDSVGLPPEVDLHLVDAVEGAPVRFFLPPGAAEALAEAGLDVFDSAATVRFDHDTFARTDDERTPWDRAYDDLVADITRFGFTYANRNRLLALEARFAALAQAKPTPFRMRQWRIIRTHAALWNSKYFDQLARTVTANAGRLRAPVHPPESLVDPRR
jgi:hypothetical protein